MKEGYLDDVLDVLDAHCHPCIMMGRYAFLWMGLEVFAEQPLELLIWDGQINAITTDLLRTGRWIEVPLVPEWREDYLQPPLRVFDRTDGSFSIKIWSEEAAHLTVDLSSVSVYANGTQSICPSLIQTPLCEAQALNPVLLESDMHPGPENASRKPNLLTTPGIRFLPHVPCQSASRQPQTKVYVPSIARYLDALLGQLRWLEENVRHPMGVYGPRADVSLFVRYLFLELPGQREKLLPLLKGESRGDMEKILDGYKRTHKLNARLFLSQKLKEESDGVPSVSCYSPTLPSA